jgi:hypothetical protein
VRIEIEAPPQITQRAIQLDRAQRLPALRQLLRDAPWERVLVFVASRYTADLVSTSCMRTASRPACCTAS